MRVEGQADKSELRPKFCPWVRTISNNEDSRDSWTDDPSRGSEQKALGGDCESGIRKKIHTREKPDWSAYRRR